MFNFDFTNIISTGVEFLGRVLLAIVIWFVARLLIRFAVKMTRRMLDGRHFEKTLANYMCSAMDIGLTVLLVVAMLGYFGLETTSFAALMAGVGIAIGAAVSGLLAHFAAGMFLLTLRPFKVGDFVSAGGVTGTVLEIGMFNTVVNTPDNVRTYVGNNTVFSGNIQNFSANTYRRVLVPVQIAHGVDPKQVMEMLKERAAKIDNVMTDPAPAASISEFRPAGPVITLAVFCHNSNYWQVFFDSNLMVRESFREAGLPVPQEVVRLMSNN